MSKKEIKFFEDFLKSQGAYNYFIKSFYSKANALLVEDKDMTLKKYYPLSGRESKTGLLSGAFIWSRTSQGQPYWNAVDKGWKAHLNNN